MSITSRISSMEEHVTNAYNGLQGLGADLTNVNKNIENISMVLDDIYDSMPQVSGEGTSLTLDDTRVGKIKSTLKGNTSQSGTPTPTTPIPVNVVSGDNKIVVCGKNLYNSSDTTYYSACTYVSGANTNQYKIKATGTDIIINSQTSSGSSYSSNAGTLIPCKYGETIYYDIGNSNFGKNYVTQYNANKVSLGFSALNTGSSSGSYTPTNSDCEYISIRIGYGSATSGTEYTLAPIFSKVSNLTYEPYQGNTYNIDLPVENLLQCNIVSTTTGGVTITNNNDESFTLQGTATVGIGRDIHGEITLKAGTYTFSADYLPAGVYISLANVSNTILNRATPSRTFTISTDTTYAKCLLWIDSGYTVNDTIKIQLEKGSKQNNFTPYGTTPIELCKIGDYKDYFYKDSDKWYLHKEIGKVVLNGSETISSYVATSLSGSYQATFEITTKATSTDKIVLSDYFTSALLSDRTTKTNICYTYSDGLLRIATNLATTMADFKAWLSTHNVVVYYVLATPVNTALEDM